MERILKQKKQNKEKTFDADKSESNFIDFDNIDESALSNDPYAFETYLDEDMTNIGFWIMTYHPNFFDGSCQGFCRYIIWLTFTLIVQVVQATFVIRFDMQAILDNIDL